MIFRDNACKLDVRFRQDIINKQTLIKFINHGSENYIIHGLNDGRIIVYDILNMTFVTKKVP